VVTGLVLNPAILKYDVNPTCKTGAFVRQYRTNAASPEEKAL